MADPPPSSNVSKLLGAGALPLLVYPCCFLANLMSFAGHPSPSPPFLLKVVALGFLWSSTLYPLVYFPFMIRAKQLEARRSIVAAERAASMPLRYLVGVAILYAAWMVLSPAYGY